MINHDPYAGHNSPAYLGKKGVEFSGLDTFPTPSSVHVVRMSSDEVTSMCPITGQPDFEVFDITYAPRKLCIESKSLKLYFHSLRDVGAFVEALADDTARLIVDTIDPAWVRVSVTQKARGGVSIVAVATRGPSADEDAPLPTDRPPVNSYLGY